LTAREQLETFGAPYGVGRSRVGEMLELVGLADKAGTREKKLSGGQRQRLSIACALMHEPQVVFLDEPTAALDPQAHRNLWDVLRLIQARGVTVVYTTHYLDEATAPNLPGAESVSADGEEVVVSSREPARLLTALADADRLDGVSVRTATLEDVFLHLTGREYRA
jgi:ABC-2 type transport system ATP-binding protein